ncbi:hypothetical protein C9374_006147 [Naegleria lovaniensis]|uniref:Uncharacterized protein n=1 Tax=Naegleria lovaniensis TaxID=51637 RepID=A0AA88GPF7_NAELO|nr:uncharacterized protein C9374_006147 [Naegleria lovaniensis]KAG2381763.1 hypothetical protein C9374_006147 [Naegleria lovaniensis]
MSKAIVVDEENDFSEWMERCETDLSTKLSEVHNVIQDLSSSHKSSKKSNFCTIHKNCLILRPISIDGKEFNDACAQETNLKEQADVFDEDTNYQSVLEQKLDKFISLWQELIHLFNKQPLNFLKTHGITSTLLKEQTFGLLTTIHGHIMDYSQKIHRTYQSLPFAVNLIPYYLTWIELSSDFRPQFENQFKEFLQVWRSRYKEILNHLQNTPTEMYLFEHYYSTSVIDHLKQSKVGYDRDILSKLESCLNLNFQTLKQLSAEKLK